MPGITIKNVHKLSNCGCDSSITVDDYDDDCATPIKRAATNPGRQSGVNGTKMRGCLSFCRHIAFVAFTMRRVVVCHATAQCYEVDGACAATNCLMLPQKRVLLPACECAQTHKLVGQPCVWHRLRRSVHASYPCRRTTLVRKKHRFPINCQT